MEKKKPVFEDFIATVDVGQAGFVTELHGELTGLGCKLELKEAKSGFVASYVFNKKTVANYVFRKKGMIVRIYANHINDYENFLDTMPENMIKVVSDAPVCKRMIDLADCNSRCPMGYEFKMKEEKLQRCRYNAFMFLLSDENNPFIKTFLLNEAEACVAAK